MENFYVINPAGEHVSLTVLYESYYNSLTENYPTVNDVLLMKCDEEDIPEMTYEEKAKVIEEEIYAWINEDTDFIFPTEFMENSEIYTEYSKAERQLFNEYITKAKDKYMSELGKNI